jgi:hypothetical protein
MNSVENPLPTLPIGRYRHFKGNDYEVLGVARHAITDEAVVIYRPLYGANASFWVRPYANFTEIIERDGQRFPRFVYASEPS